MECRISDSTADQAGYWDARLRSPDCSGLDRTLFAEWRDSSPRNREAFERLQAVVATLRHNRARADVRALRDAALSAEKPRAPRRRILIAAAAVAGLAVAATFWPSGPPRGEIYETGTGQRSISTLQDGSSIELDARTRIKVDFNSTQRNVELVYGQALFHVAHNPSRPFIVRAADREITALGTQFDVRLDETSVRVTLIEGKVQVSQDSSHAKTATLDTAPPAVLTPGQQFVALASNTADDSAARVRSVDIAKVTGWRVGRIFLEDLILTDAVAEMNRHSPVQIIVGDPRIAELRVNGMFRADEQEAFVTALEQYFPINARHNGDTEIILTLRR
jgi:transmembrane sensor